jgi:ABC-type transporter Mla subunit MlaD
MDPAERGVLATKMYSWLGSELAPGMGDLFGLRANFEELAVQHEVSREENRRVLHRAEQLEAEIARTRRSISSIITRMHQQADVTATRLAKVTEQQSLLLDIESREHEKVSLPLTDLETVLQETLHELAKSRHAYRRLVGRRSVRAALRVARFAQPLFRVVRRRRRIRSQHD